MRCLQGSGRPAPPDVSRSWQTHPAPSAYREVAGASGGGEITSCGIPASDNYDKVDEEMISPMRMFSSPPQDGEPMSVHMEYFSEQLKNFDMAESDEEGGNFPNMQCLREELVKVIGSTKRSLLHTLEKADSEKKGKFQEGASAKWGLVLSIRPATREHGEVNIMDKDKAYQKKKSLEIPNHSKSLVPLAHLPCAAMSSSSSAAAAAPVLIRIVEKLPYSNFNVWHAQALATIRGAQLFSYLNPEREELTHKLV
ncbi:hypothetical protein D1007_16508 [Hordeum vulgare]|nr:hypothetical protein D1007_16508 [Hordeum vulgare]